MIKSMTGYGRGNYENDGRMYTVEIKTINHRYNDVSVKLPRYLNFLEDNIRRYISKTINRGKVEVYISLENMSDKGRNIKIDKVFFIKLFVGLLVLLHATSGGRKQKQTGKKNRFCFFHKV